jgi:hypothetical protein
MKDLADWRMAGDSENIAERGRVKVASKVRPLMTVSKDVFTQSCMFFSEGMPLLTRHVHYRD